MVITKEDVLKNITDYQLKIVILLRMGFRIGNGLDTDGKMVMWLEKDNKYFDISLRKDSLNKILTFDLMKIDEVKSKQLTLYYIKTEKVDEVLFSVGKEKVGKLKPEALKMVKPR